MSTLFRYGARGMQNWEFFQPAPPRAFEGHTAFSNAVGACPDEEVWVEARARTERRETPLSSIGQDPAFTTAIGELGKAVSSSFRTVMGDFNPVSSCEPFELSQTSCVFVIRSS